MERIISLRNEKKEKEKIYFLLLLVSNYTVKKIDGIEIVPVLLRNPRFAIQSRVKPHVF